MPSPDLDQTRAGGWRRSAGGILHPPQQGVPSGLEEVLEVNPELLTELRIAVVQANGAVNLKYVDPQVVPGETYYYHVLSVDKARNWKCSVEVSATVLEAAVPVASSPQAPDVVANQPVTFSWQAPVLDYDDQVATYTLEYAYTADFSDAVSIANIAQTQFTSAQEVLAWNGLLAGAGITSQALSWLSVGFL